MEGLDPAVAATFVIINSSLPLWAGAGWVCNVVVSLNRPFNEKKDMESFELFFFFSSKLRIKMSEGHYFHISCSRSEN